MNITEVKIRKVMKDESDLKAIVSITIDDCLAIHDIKIIQNGDRLFLAMPSKRLPSPNKNGSVFTDIIHPIGAEARKEMEDMIFPVYFSALTSLEEEENERAMSTLEE